MIGFFQRRANIGILAVVLAVILGGTVLMMKSCLAEKSGKTEGQQAAPAKDPANDIAETEWTLRCVDAKGKQLKEKEDGAQCEVFKSLVTAGGKTRVAELAIGFPDPKNKDAARGAIVLPLGVMLDQDVALKVDENKPFGFKILYCTNLGCFSLINANKDLLDQMEEGKAVHFLFRAMNGQNVDMSVNLSGFSKALKQAK